MRILLAGAIVSKAGPPEELLQAIGDYGANDEAGGDWRTAGTEKEPGLESTTL